MKPTQQDVRRLVAVLMDCVRGIENAKRKGLASQLALLQAIAQLKKTSPSALQAELGWHLSHVTRQIQSLAAAGLARVSVHPVDGRSRVVELTRKGKAELSQLTEMGLKRFALFLEGWDAGEVRSLAALLEKFQKSKADAVQRHPQPLRRRRSTAE